MILSGRSPRKISFLVTTCGTPTDNAAPWSSKKMKGTLINIHLGRLIVYSATVSGNLEGYVRGCLRLFRVIFEGYLGGVLESFQNTL
mgnify:CR=1 FL=1